MYFFLVLIFNYTCTYVSITFNYIIFIVIKLRLPGAFVCDTLWQDCSHMLQRGPSDRFFRWPTQWRNPHIFPTFKRAARNCSYVHQKGQILFWMCLVYLMFCGMWHPIFQINRSSTSPKNHEAIRLVSSSARHWVVPWPTTAFRCPATSRLPWVDTGQGLKVRLWPVQWMGWYFVKLYRTCFLKLFSDVVLFLIYFNVFFVLLLLKLQIDTMWYSCQCCNMPNLGHLLTSSGLNLIIAMLFLAEPRSHREVG